MKRLLIYGILTLCFATQAYAGGRVLLSPEYRPNRKELDGNIGISVYEPLIGALAFESWMGVGRSHDVNDIASNWASGKLGVDLSLDNGLLLGVAFGLSTPINTLALDPKISAKIGYNLW